MGFIAKTLGISTDNLPIFSALEAKERYVEYFEFPVGASKGYTDGYVGIKSDGVKERFYLKTTEIPINRISKTEYYLKIAEAVASRGTCLRRKFGAIIVKNDMIVSSGYVGAPRGRENCCDLGECFRMKHNIPSGTQYEKCRSIHAEMNAIISASKEEMEGATMYLTGIENDGSYTNSDCCAMCKRAVINSGIVEVIARQKDGSHIIYKTNDWVTNDDSLDINHEGY